MRKKIEVRAISDKDIKKILGELGVAARIDAEEVYCESCLRQMTWGNIGAILVKNEELVLFCNLSECIEEANTGGGAQ